MALNVYSSIGIGWDRLACEFATTTAAVPVRTNAIPGTAVQQYLVYVVSNGSMLAEGGGLRVCTKHYSSTKYKWGVALHLLELAHPAAT